MNPLRRIETLPFHALHFKDYLLYILEFRAYLMSKQNFKTKFIITLIDRIQRSRLI
jgi:hypothetical protein